MPKFLIERDIPNVGSLSADEMRAVSQTSCNTLQHLGPSVQWVQSFVTDNKVYCVYIAPNAEMIRQHSEHSGIPAHKISQITEIIDPTTAELV
jgi:hypothetical protein